MKEKLYQYIIAKYAGASIWGHDETKEYFYIRFIFAGSLHLMCYYKSSESIEIFELKRGESYDHR